MKQQDNTHLFETTHRQSTEELAAALTDLVQRLASCANKPDEERLMFRGGRPVRKPKTIAATMRITVGDWNKFHQMCELNGYTVAEGFAQLTKHLPLNPASEQQPARKDIV